MSDCTAPCTCEPPAGAPEAPGGPGWELQYCKWFGWTWVRRGDREVLSRQPDVRFAPEEPRPPAKKRRRFRGCFQRRRKARTPPARQPYPPGAPGLQPCPPGAPGQTQTSRSDVALRQSGRGQGDCCCCCCCCDFECCCCCCCPDDEGAAGGPPKCCRNSETQTLREMKEKATKMSEVQIADRGRQTQTQAGGCQCRCRQRRCRCMCKRSCCPCAKTAQNACPCVRNAQNTCPCVQKKESDEKKGADEKKVHCGSKSCERLINLCLTGETRKPNLSSFDFKSTFFKSLDILLQNNTNIMDLLSDNKKEFRREDKISSLFDLSKSISCLSIENALKKPDDEHCKILSAVCDAILSSHKFENDSFHVLKNIKSNTTEKSNCDSKLSSNTGILDKIMNDLNYPPTMQKMKSSETTNLHKEIGIQVSNPEVKKYESTTSKRTSKLLTKLSRSKSRISNVSRPLKKDDTLTKIEKNIDLIKTSLNKELFENEKDVPVTEEKKEKPTPDDDFSSKLSLPIKFDFRQHTLSLNQTNAPIEKVSQYRSVNNLLDFNFHNNDNSDDDKNITSLHREHKEINLLDLTSPPFTDFDLPFSNDKEDSDNKSGKTFR